LLNELRNALIVLRNPGHNGLGLDHLHVIGNAEYFLGAKPPKFWIVNFVRLMRLSHGILLRFQTHLAVSIENRCGVLLVS